MRLFLLLLFSSTCYTGFSQVSFENQAQALGAGVAYGHVMLGAGISFYDYDGDGLDDITIASSDSNDYTFLKNNGTSFDNDLLPMTSSGNQSKQVMWVDYDNDGDADFYAASDQGLSRLHRNDGGGVFTDVTVACGFPSEVLDIWGAAWGDYDNDGNLDVFFSLREPTRTVPNFLYRNNGDGTFTDVTVSAGLETSGHLTFCASFFDYDKDGYQDIYMANDKFYTNNILYRNNGDGTFEDVSIASGADVYMSAMSTTIGDYNNDGWLDVYVTNDFPPEPGGVYGNALLENNGDGTFTNVATSTGTVFESLGWGAVFLDAENDGYTDLYVSGGRDGSNGFLPAAFYSNDGDNTFTIPNNIGFGDDTEESYANAIGDIDNDGYPEIIVLNNNGEEIFLWKNTTPTNNNWLKVKLQGVESNRMGIGSWIEIGTGDHVQYNYTVCGEGYLSQNSGVEFFGINDATVVDYVKVTWLSGTIDYLEDVAINQLLEIVEGDHPLSIEDQSETMFALYPNPAKNLLTIKQIAAIDAEVSIFDLSGKKVLATAISGTESQVKLNTLQSGIYVVEIVSEGGSHTQKLVIQ